MPLFFYSLGNYIYEQVLDDFMRVAKLVVEEVEFL